MTPRTFHSRLSHLMAFVAAIGIALGIFIYEDIKIKKHKRDVGNEGLCQSKLNNIAIALLNYSEEFGRFPPPFSVDKERRRTQSWRATIARWIGFQQEVVAAYQFDEPWDSEENKKLWTRATGFYLCPADQGSKPPQNTSYFMINDLSKFNPSTAPKAAILVIEMGNCNHAWMNPFDDACDLVQTESIRSNHPHGFGVILGDFTRLRLKDTKRIKKQGDYYLLSD
jgi:hypothetical protein